MNINQNTPPRSPVYKTPEQSPRVQKTVCTPAEKNYNTAHNNRQPMGNSQSANTLVPEFKITIEDHRLNDGLYLGSSSSSTNILKRPYGEESFHTPPQSPRKRNKR